MTSFIAHRRNSALDSKIRQMALPLAPLVQLTTGLAHPSFPCTLLNFWLLTESELDDIAHFYHQRTPCAFTEHYPKIMGWRDGLTIEDKRRKLGKFIGLRGCETPVMVKSGSEIWEEARMAREHNEREIWRRKLGGR